MLITHKSDTESHMDYCRDVFIHEPFQPLVTICTEKSSVKRHDDLMLTKFTFFG